MRSFAQLETDQVRKNVERSQAAIQEEIAQLQRTVKDWAVWDDTYNFVKKQESTYITENFNASVFNNLNVNSIMIMHQASGKILYGQFIDLQTSEFIAIPADLLQQLKPASPLISHQNNHQAIAGVIKVQDQPLLLVSSPVLNSQQQGQIQGAFLMGRILNEPAIKSLENRTKLNINIYSLDQINKFPVLEQVYQQLEKPINLQIHSSIFTNHDQILVKPENREIVNGYTLIYGIDQQPIFLLEITVKRDIYQQGRLSLFYLMTALILVTIIFTVLALILLDKIILYRLFQLAYDVEKIRDNQNLALRVNFTGDDELSYLGGQINQMLTELEISAKDLAIQQEKAERLLRNILPEDIVCQLKDNHQTIANSFAEVTILFADIVGFTEISAQITPDQLVSLLNSIFSEFDLLTDQLGLEKIKTIGDAYMVVGGLPLPRADHAEAIADFALEMQKIIGKFYQATGEALEIRIGINTGPAVAGVIGLRKFVYDLWGDAVNTASRMESSGLPGKIQVSASTYEKLKGKYYLEKRGLIEVKGKGTMETFWLIDKFSTL
jgi:class 3 adenylate cyclase/sensor domain CHASE-containing protein